MSNNTDMIKMVRLLEGQQFAGEKVGQKPGDQVRGTDKAKVGGKDHPFKGRLVGEETALEDVLAKKYQDFKDLQAKEKEKKKEKEELDEQGVNEVSDQTLKNYLLKVDSDARKHRMDPTKRDPRKASNSIRHFARAFNKLDARLNKSDPYNKMADVDEGMLDHPGHPDSPVANAIIRRILLQRTDLLGKYGPEKVGAAVDDVADFVGDVDEIGSSDVSGWVRHVEQILGNMDENIGEAANPTDTVSMDVPLLIRIMEYAREDASNDMVLHDVAENLIRLSAGGKTLSMKDYDAIVGQTTEGQINELGATMPTPPQGTATGATSPTTANAAATSGNISPDEQTALNKINQTPAMKQQLDKLMTQATPGSATAPMKLDQDEQEALNRIKTNAGLGSQYAKLIAQANPAAAQTSVAKL